jgi:hypothetical protein
MPQIELSIWQEVSMSPLKIIIKKLGGAAYVARKLKKPTSSVSNWIYRDNAKRSQLQMILDLALQEGVAVSPADFFIQPTKEVTHHEDYQQSKSKREGINACPVEEGCI